MSSVPSWFASAACLAVGTYNWHPCQHAVCVVGQPMGHRTGAGRGGHTATHTGEEEWVYSPGPSRSVYQAWVAWSWRPTQWSHIIRAVLNNNDSTQIIAIRSSAPLSPE